MKRIIFFVLSLVLLQSFEANSQTRTLDEIRPDSMTVGLARMMGKDIFELNGVPYLQPTVEVMNITSNARFYNSAYVPKKVDKPYFRVGLHGMYGFVPDAKKTYAPQLPVKELTLEGALEYGSLDLVNQSYSITDTAGLIYAALQGMLYDGLQQGKLQVPGSAPTAVGKGKQRFELPDSVLKDLFENLTVELPILGETKLYDYLPEDVKQELDSIFKSFPEFFNLPEGADLNSFFAFVPQFEIGSLFGTELLIRYIPPIDMGEDIGDFTFWGFGLKHSISQYFNPSDDVEERYFDMAVQAVYQGTTLENSIGVTNADLKATATMFNVNLHASKSFEGIIDVYTGISYESIEIKSEYVYYLPIEMQWDLGLIDKYNYENPNFEPTTSDFPDTQYNHPGDQNPQSAEITLTDSAIKWTLGLSKDIGPVTIFTDFNYSTMMMFSGGIIYKF